MDIGWMVGGSNQLAGGENFSLLLMATRNPAVANQLRLVVYLIIYRVLAPSQVVVSRISSINGGNTLGIRDFLLSLGWGNSLTTYGIPSPQDSFCVEKNPHDLGKDGRSCGGKKLSCTTLLKTNSSHLAVGLPKRKLIWTNPSVSGAKS